MQTSLSSGALLSVPGQALEISSDKRSSAHKGCSKPCGKAVLPSPLSVLTAKVCRLELEIKAWEQIWLLEYKGNPKCQGLVCGSGWEIREPRGGLAEWGYWGAIRMKRSKIYWGRVITAAIKHRITALASSPRS